MNTKILVLVSVILSALALTSCVKKAEIDTFPPVGQPSCTDKIKNGTEYNVDCGGYSCVPCKVGPPTINVTVDSTWVLDSNKTEFRYWTPRWVIVNDTADAANVVILATDTFDNHSGFLSLVFKVPKGLKHGVYEINDMKTYEQYVSFPPNIPGSFAKLQSGVITIEDVDAVNGYMTGKFEFITEPVDFYKYRVAFVDGVMVDIPYR